MDRFDLTTVIVNWNTSELLDGVLQNLADHAPAGRSHQVIVVDNDSADDSTEMLQRKWPEVQLIQMGENSGFCRANNAAIRASDSEYVLLINTDGRVKAGSIDAMLGYLEADPLAAVVGPRLTYADGSFQRTGAGRSLTLRTAANHFLFLERLAGRFPALSSYWLATDTREPQKVGWVCSAVMMLRRSALDEIGLLDERIFLYMDDVDLCRRATDAGWNVWYAADVDAVHFMSSSSGQPSGIANPETVRSAIRWFDRYNPRWKTVGYRGVAATGFAVRAAGFGVRSLLGGDRELLRKRAANQWQLSKVSVAPV